MAYKNGDREEHPNDPRFLSGLGKTYLARGELRGLPSRVLERAVKAAAERECRRSREARVFRSSEAYDTDRRAWRAPSISCAAPRVKVLPSPEILH